MYVLDRNKDIVGYSMWPWDDLYAPVIGLYRNGRLLSYAICDLLPQDVRLEGPGQRCWFRLRADQDARHALEDDDPSVRLMRMEDGVEIRPSGARAGERVIRSRHAVDVFLSQTSVMGASLDGFASFLEAPLMHQLDIIFLDVLNRLPDPEARHHYGIALDTGGMSVLAARAIVMDSAEFRERNITISDRVGSLITSPLWHELREAEPLGERRTALPAIRMSRYAELSDEDFVRAIHADCHGDAPSDEATQRLAAIAGGQGRAEVATLLVRDAASVGAFLKVIDG